MFGVTNHQRAKRPLRGVATLRGRRSPSRMLRDDLRRDRMMGLPTMARIVRRRPRLVAVFVVDLVIVAALFVALLMLAGGLDDFGNWAFGPALILSGIVGAQLRGEQLRLANPRPRPEDKITVDELTRAHASEEPGSVRA